MGARILVVDDDELLCESVCISLRDQGFLTFSCGLAEEAILVARRVRPHLIVLDVMFPGRSGLDLLADIRRDSALQSVPVVMLTSVRRPAQVVQARDLGASAYVVKPIEPRALVERVSQVLSLTSPLRAAASVGGVEWLD